MAEFSINADIRAADEKLSTMRKTRRLPGVVYGKTQEPISLSLDGSDFLRLYRKAGESSIISLNCGKKELEVVIHQTQKHPVTWDFTHVDFYAITRGETLQTKVALSFVGEPQAKKDGCIIEEIMKEIEVKCLPRNLVDHFDVDLTLLAKAGDVVRVSDLGLDREKYEIMTILEDVVASATLPRAAVASDNEEEWTEESTEGEESA